jgi:ribose 5-phosphate isomerase B
VRIAFGTDEETPLTEAVRIDLESRGHDVAFLARGEAWPEVGRAVGEEVAAGRADRGIVCCWTGTGVSIAANKIAGVRAALCTDAATAGGARKWNDANVLAFGLRLTSPTLAAEMIDAFLRGEPDAAEVSVISRVEGP